MVATPLQNGMFGMNTVSVTHDVMVTSSPGLILGLNASTQLSVNVLNSAYSSMWLGQQLPAFTARNYSVAPFHYDYSQGFNLTITAPTFQYWSEVVCWQPVAFNVTQSFTVSIDDGKGCNAQDILTLSTMPGSADSNWQFEANHIGYYSDAESDESLALAGCPLSAEHRTLTTWRRSSLFPPDFSDPKNATALFCEATYFTQPGNATVLAPGNSLVGFAPTAERRILSDEEFNRTQFEYILAAGVPPSTASLQDVSAITAIRLDSHLSNLSLAIPTDNMVGYIAGIDHLSPESYLDPSTLHEAVQSSHQYLFAVASSLSMNNQVNGDPRHAQARQFVFAAILIQSFTISAQLVLTVVAILLFYAVLSYSRRTLRLQHNPDSLAQVMSLARSSVFQSKFSKLDTASELALSDAIKHQQFRLMDDRCSTPCMEVVDMRSRNELSKEQLRISRPARDPVNALEASFPAVLAVAIAIAAVLASLVALNWVIRERNGLSLPTDNQIVLQILFNLLPTTIGTLLDAYWNLLTRLSCFMRPLEELSKGSASAAQTLLPQYEHLPPQIVFWRAVNSGHYLLGLSSVTTLLAAILTIALSGIFLQHETLSSHTAAAHLMYDPVVNSSAYTGFVAMQLDGYSRFDSYYVALSNLSANTSLPTWLSPDYAFIPLNLNLSTPLTASQHVQAEMTGYGADSNCFEMHQTTFNTSGTTFALDISSDAQLLRFVSTHPQPDGQIIQCTFSGANMTTNSSTSNDLYLQTFIGAPGHLAMEVQTGLSVLSDQTGATFTPEGLFCRQVVVKGWIRANISSAASNSSRDNVTLLQPADMQQTFVSCNPRMKTARFNISMQPDGTILSAQQLSSHTYDLPATVNLTQFFNDTDDLMINAGSTNTWHKNTVNLDWTNQMISALRNSSSFIDPALPPPTAQEAVDALANLYSRLFAIQFNLRTNGLQLINTTKASLSTEDTLQATIYTPQIRIFLSRPLFYISVSILSLDLIVLLLYHLHLSAPFLPRMPYTIASQIAFFAGSHVIDDVVKAGGDLKQLDKKGYRYGYGKYIGKDGWIHTGIEREPYVQPIAQSSRSGLRDRWLRRRRTDESKGDDSAYTVSAVDSFRLKDMRGKEVEVLTKSVSHGSQYNTEHGTVQEALEKVNRSVAADDGDVPADTPLLSQHSYTSSSARPGWI